MPSLAETTARLRRASRTSTQVRTKAHVRFEAIERFGDNPGQLRLMRYVPTGLTRHAALVVVLHGCTQNGAAFAERGGWVELAERQGFALLAPEQIVSNNPNLCFNWFLHEDTERGHGEVASIAHMINHMVGDIGLDPDRVFITGLSAGGAMTAAMLATYPELFSGGAIIAGLPYGAARTLVEAVSAMRHVDLAGAAERADRLRHAAPAPVRAPRLSIWHGDADWVVNVANAEAVAAQWVDAMALKPSVPAPAPEGVARTVWSAPGASTAQVELNLVKGLGHGIPLSTRGEDGLGHTAPYMLEAGISSTREIARFWGLSDGQAPPAHGSATIAKPPVAAERLSEGALGQGVVNALNRYIPAEVSDAIAKALRAAGLLK
jgi:poly(hydroxyalkanoate) depolymerase family esterase